MEAAKEHLSHEKTFLARYDIREEEKGRKTVYFSSYFSSPKSNDDDDAVRGRRKNSILAFQFSLPGFIFSLSDFGKPISSGFFDGSINFENGGIIYEDFVARICENREIVPLFSRK